MGTDLRSLFLNSLALLAGAGFCASAGLDFYITRGSDGPSLAANREVRAVLRARFWGQAAPRAAGQELSGAARMEFYRMLILRGGPVDVPASDELPLQLHFAQWVQAPEFLDQPVAVRELALDWAGEDLPNEEGRHVYSIPLQKLPSLEARARAGDCGAARRLASYDAFGALGAYDMELEWARLAARCPGGYFKEALFEKYLFHGVKPQHEREVGDLLDGIAAIEPGRAARFLRENWANDVK